MDKETLFVHMMFKTQYGSRLYGTSGLKSDTDWKYLFLPTLKDTLLGKQIMKTKFVSPNMEDKSLQVDEDFVPVQKFAHDFLKGVPYAIEVAFGADGNHAEQKYVHAVFSPFVHELREKFLTRKLSGFLGFVNNMIMKVEKEPLSKLDFKDMYHGLRVAHQATELLRTGNLTLPLNTPVSSNLLKVKNGEVPMYQVAEDLLTAYKAMENALNETQLQEFTPVLEAKFETWMFDWLKKFYGLNNANLSL